MIDQATVDKIIDSANILEVVSDFVTLRKRGVNYVGLCPFHDEKTPSFSVSPSKGICKCFSCGKGGSAVHFIMEHEQLSYYEALKYLAKKYNIEIEGKHAVVIGRSNIVGKPLAQCLLNKNATVTTCHSRTRNLKEMTKQADILVAAIGKPKFVTEDMVKDNAVVIDVGINRNEEGKLVGDVDYQNVEKKASYITPVPGGVGPMTIAMLMTNVVKAAKNN